MKLGVVVGLLLIGSVIGDKTLPPLDPSNINCQSDRVTIKIPDSELTDAKIGTGHGDITDVFITKDVNAYDAIDAACVAVRRETEKDWYFDLDLTGNGIKCAKAGSGTTTLDYTFVVYVKPFIKTWLLASYSPKINFVVVCGFKDTVGQKAPENAISPSKGSEAFKMADATTDFDVLVKYYPNGFDQAAAPVQNTYEIEIGTSVNMQYELKSDYWNDLVLQAKTCFLSPYADPTKTPKIGVIKEWCRVDDLLTGNLNGVVKNSVDKQVQFYFSTFFWSELKSSSIYVHCDLFICSTKAGDTCTKTCAKRARRSVVDDEVEDEEFGEGKIVTLGPFNITSEEEKCDPEKYGCEQGCMKDENGIISCTCDDKYQLADDMKSCQQIIKSFYAVDVYNFYEISKSINVYIRRDTQTGFAFVIVVIILMLTITHIIYRIKKTTSTSENKWNYI